MWNVAKTMFPPLLTLKAGSKNYRRHILLTTAGDVLSSFGFFSSPNVSGFGHVARYAPSTTYTCELKIIPKSNKANF